jgi:hypothetical protein
MRRKRGEIAVGNIRNSITIVEDINVLGELEEIACHCQQGHTQQVT